MNTNLLRIFLLIFLPYAAAITFGFSLFAYVQYTHNIKLIKKNETLQLDLVKKSLVRDLTNILPDIEILVNERHVQQYINKPSEPARKLVEEEITSFSRNKRIYRQIRFIGIDGMEIIRVDYVNNQPVVIDKDKLRNKKDRYYFKDSIRHSRSELYISPLDLDIEDGKIVQPFVPTIRFAMPVYDDSNKLHGIIVLNYKAENLLHNFDEMLTDSYGHIALLNEDGYWLRSHKKEREWAFMFNKEVTFGQRHYQEWLEISSLDSGQIHSDDGLFTYVSVYPLKIIGGYSEQELQNEHLAHHHNDPDVYVWKIISDVPSRTINKIRHDQVFSLFGLIWLILLFMGLFTSWHLATTYQERRKLRQMMELHAKIYNSSTDGIIITDTSENIIDVNEAFQDISGYSREEIIGNKPSMFSSGQHDSSFYVDIWNELNNKGYWEGELLNRHKNGSIYTEWIRISAIRDAANKVVNYIALISDITHKKLAEEQLLKYAHHDPLTGAHNRLSFNERFQHDVLLANRNEYILAVLYLDLDKFKPINDTHGHHTGDIVLKTITRRINNNIRATDTLARLGGDEFVILLPQIEHKHDAEKIANTLRLIIREPIHAGDLQLSVDVSIGIAIYPDDGKSEKDLLHHADQDMYNMKTSKPV